MEKSIVQSVKTLLDSWFFLFQTIQSRDSLFTARRLFFWTSRKLAITRLFLDILTWKNYCNFFKYMSFECQNIFQQVYKPLFKKKSSKRRFFASKCIYPLKEKNWKAYRWLPHRTEFFLDYWPYQCALQHRSGPILYNASSWNRCCHHRHVK